MNYIEYRARTFVKPLLVISLVLLWFLAGHIFAKQVWTPFFEEPENNYFDDGGFYYTVDNRYEKGFWVYVLSQVVVAVVVLDYRTYVQTITNKEETQ